TYDRIVIATGARYRFGLGLVANLLLDHRAARWPVLRSVFAMAWFRDWLYHSARQSTGEAARRVARPRQKIVLIGDALRPGNSRQGFAGASGAALLPWPPNTGPSAMRPASPIIATATLAFALCASGAVHPASAQLAQRADAAAFLAGQTKDCPGCNLAGVSLKRRNLAGANLAGANLAGASFHRAVLRGANLSGADLTGANLNKTDLIQADLSSAKLANAMLFEADASRANFSRANLTEALMGSIRLLNGRLDRAILTEADLEAALLNEANFSNATLNGANLHQGRMLRVNMSGAVANSTEFTQANLRDANLSGAQFGESVFYLADLSGANLSGADLNHAVLRSANLGNTNQTGTVFTGAMMPDNTIHPCPDCAGRLSPDLPGGGNLPPYPATPAGEPSPVAAALASAPLGA